MSATEKRGRFFLEGLLIVGSILLAFGIEAAWSEAQERRIEAEYLEALAAEAGENIAEVEASLRQADLAMAALERADRILASGAAEDSAVALLESVLQGVVWSGAPARSTAVMDDLTGTHGLGIIRSQDVRRAVLRYEATVDAFFFRAAYLGESVSPRLNQVVSRWTPIGYSQFGADGVDPEGWSEQEVRRAVRGLASDAQLSGEIRAEYRRFQLQRRFVEAAIPQHREIRQVLENARQAGP